MSKHTPDERADLISELDKIQKDIERMHYPSSENATKMENLIRKAIIIMDKLQAVVGPERNLLNDNISIYLSNYRNYSSKKNRDSEFERARKSSALNIKSVLLSLGE